MAKPVPPLPGQLELVTHIMRLFGNRPAEPRHFNAIVSAADSIFAEFNRVPIGATPGMGLKAWLKSDDVGGSSHYMASVLGGFHSQFAYPHDAADFGRCVRLLFAAPELRDQWHRLEALPQPWPSLVQHWAELNTLYEEALKAGDGRTFSTRLKELYQGGEHWMNRGLFRTAEIS